MALPLNGNQTSQSGVPFISIAERNTHVHINPDQCQAGQRIEREPVGCYVRRPIRPRFQNRSRDTLQGMDGEGGETDDGARNR
jgi:hypothetical protein